LNVCIASAAKITFLNSFQGFKFLCSLLKHIFHIFRYVTSSGTSSDVVYCWQLDSLKSAALPVSSVTLSDNDVNKTSSEGPGQIAISSPGAPVAPILLKKERSTLTETEKALKHNNDVLAVENDTLRDDMLANVIEASDDDDDDVISAKPLMNGHVTPKDLAINNGTNATTNGFHESLSKVIQKTIMQVGGF